MDISLAIREIPTKAYDHSKLVFKSGYVGYIVDMQLQLTVDMHHVKQKNPGFWPGLFVKGHSLVHRL
jgi:hypothetical protein